MTGTERKLGTLEPDFRPVVEELLKATEIATGRKWGVSDGRRTMAEQKTIYAQGRTVPGKVVSNAQPGSSAHNFGLAVDIWPIRADGKDFDWAAPDFLFRKMAAEAKKLGLTPGYSFKSIHDAPHVEHPRWRTQQALWREGRIKLA